MLESLEHAPLEHGSSTLCSCATLVLPSVMSLEVFSGRTSVFALGVFAWGGVFSREGFSGVCGDVIAMFLAAD